MIFGGDICRRGYTCAGLQNAFWILWHQHSFTRSPSILASGDFFYSCGQVLATFWQGEDKGTKVTCSAYYSCFFNINCNACCLEPYGSCAKEADLMSSSQMAKPCVLPHVTLLCNPNYIWCLSWSSRGYEILFIWLACCCCYTGNSAVILTSIPPPATSLGLELHIHIECSVERALAFCFIFPKPSLLRPLFHLSTYPSPYLFI